MKGSTILLTAEPRGMYLEGTITDTSLPGTPMQIDTSKVDANGRPSVQAAAGAGTDGFDMPIWILLEDDTQGKLVSDAYVSGTRCRLYSPISGEELNVRVGEGAGTGNTIAYGVKLMLDSDAGIFIPVTGSPQHIPFQMRETLTQVAPNSLAFVSRLGG